MHIDFKLWIELLSLIQFVFLLTSSRFQHLLLTGREEKSHSPASTG